MNNSRWEFSADGEGDEYSSGPYVPDEIERLREAIVKKVRIKPVIRGGRLRFLSNDVGFRALLADILHIPWPELKLLGFELTDRGNVVGKLLKEGADIALPECLPIYVKLCDIDYAIFTICNLAEANGLSHAERAFLLNELPRFSEWD